LFNKVAFPITVGLVYVVFTVAAVSGHHSRRAINGHAACQNAPVRAYWTL